MATTGARLRVSRLVAALALGWCSFVLLANIAGGAFACAGDTSDCASVAGGGVPWDRARDLTSSPQYVSIIVLGLITMGVLILGRVREGLPGTSAALHRARTHCREHGAAAGAVVGPAVVRSCPKALNGPPPAVAKG